VDLLLVSLGGIHPPKSASILGAPPRGTPVLGLLIR
jgi:hypothetical protein